MKPLRLSLFLLSTFYFLLSPARAADHTAVDFNLRDTTSLDLAHLGLHDNADGTFSLKVYDINGGGGGGGGGGAVTIADGADITKGAKADTAATSDTGTFSQVALQKRELQDWTSFFAILPSARGQQNMAGSLSVAIASDQGAVPVGISSSVGAANGAIAQVTALANGTANLALRSTRRKVAVLNTAASETIYYGYASGVTSGNGFPLNAGQSQTLDYKGAVYVYSSSGASVVAFSETYD